MSVWVTIPSARPVAEVEKWAQAWRERGYKIALWRDHVMDGDANLRDAIACAADVYIGDFQYPGYANAVNGLIADVLMRKSDTNPEWFIAAGDDIWPDPNKTAEEIAIECKMHFYDNKAKAEGAPMPLLPEGSRLWTETFGVMQPTGDRWGEDPNAANPKHRSAYIDRVCGSAWIGREFARRINQGKGPLWPEYFHMSVDRELQGVALKYGVLWQRPDLTQLHQHWGRPKTGERMGHASNMPEFLKKANEGMAESERLCDRREREGFPGSEPL